MIIYITIDNMFAFDIDEEDEETAIAIAKELTLEAIAALPDSDLVLVPEVE